MPVNSLSITKRELRKFEGTAESGRVDITGEYEVTIKNEGVLPILASQYEVQKLSPTSVSKTLITEKSGDVGRLSPGSSESVNISFKISGNKDQLMTLARTGCNGNTIKCEVEEQISGRFLALPFDEKRNLSVSAGSCSLRSDVGQAPPTSEPEPTPSQPVQNLTMRIVGPTEVTAGQEDSWLIDGNNINEVSQIRVELGDGSTTTTRREIQAQNPRQPQTSSSPGLALSGAQQTGVNDNTSSSDARQVFTHTYSSEGQYTIVAEAINSNGETVGSARYGVTVNPQVTTDPVDPEPTKPANFDITVNSKNEPVNPGGQMVIDYTVENTGDARGTGNITLNVDGQRTDSSRRTVNAGSSTSGTLTATAPQIDSSSVIFRPQITAEGVESNTVSPSFQVSQQDSSSGDSDDEQNQTPQPVNITITNSYVDYDGAGQVGIEYEVANQTNQSQSVNIERYLSGTWIGNNQQNIAPGSAYESSYTIGYDGPGEYELGIRVDNQTQIETVTAEGQQAQPDPAVLNLQITGTSSPVNIGQDLNVQYRVINTGGQSTNATIDATTSSSNGRQTRVVETVNSGQSITGSLTIPSTAYGTSGNKTVTIQSQGASAQSGFTVRDAEITEPAELGINVFGTNSPINISEDLNIQYSVGNAGGQTTNANIDVSISSANGVQSQVVETVNPGESVGGELTVPSTAYGTAGEKTATLQVEGDSAQTNFTVQQENGGQEFDSVNEITNQLNGIDAAREIIRLHGETLREYDTNSNSEINLDELQQASGDFAVGGQLTEDETEAVEYFYLNNQYFPQDGEDEQMYLDNAELIHEYDTNGNGNIDIGESGAAGAAFTDNELTEDEIEVIEYMFVNEVKFPYSQEQQQNTFTPPTMDEVVDSGF